MFYEFNGVRPVVHESAFVHPQAVVTGQVVIGKDVYIGPGCALRGDWGAHYYFRWLQRAGKLHGSYVPGSYRVAS